MESREVIIVGGGVAGLTAAIHLSTAGFSVLVFEKHSYPRHKVCGEYLSNEVLPYFEKLGIKISHLNLPEISRFEVSTVSGNKIESELPLGGIGISRFTLDDLLYKKAVDCGATFIFDNVTDVRFQNHVFHVDSVSHKNVTAKILLGAFGKRSGLDRKLKRKFFTTKSPWLAVKSHYKVDFDESTVALHNFRGGYCGISMVEDGIVNVCFLANYKTFQRYGNIDHFRENVICGNPHLKKIFEDAVPVFDRPMTVSQINFETKSVVDNGIWMIGDSAGVIHPLCGNGMAMAVHSAKFASEIATDFLQGKISRVEAENQYKRVWNRNFIGRLRSGRIISSMLLRPRVSRMMMRCLSNFPFLLPVLIRSTHGKPISQ